MANAALNQSTSFVYVIGPEGGPYKIGVSDDVDVRRQQIQSRHPRPLLVKYRLKVLASLRFDVERTAHLRLESDRVEGEWFAVDAAVAAEAIQEAANDVSAGRLHQTPPRGARRRRQDGMAVAIKNGVLSEQQALAARLYRKVFDLAAEEARLIEIGGTPTLPPARVALDLLSKIQATVSAKVSPRAATLMLEICGKGRTQIDTMGVGRQRNRQRQELRDALNVVSGLLTRNGQAT